MVPLVPPMQVEEAKAVTLTPPAGGAGEATAVTPMKSPAQAR
jgi:hypothetical protein